MNILILGCSFGVPGIGCPEEYHTEHQLRLLKHSVYNCARPGVGNIASLKIAKDFCNKTPIKIDWVIWFHTELIRDWEDLHKEMYSNGNYLLKDLAKIVYSCYAEFLNELQAKLAVIGGAGPILPELNDYMQPEFCIPSWFNKILDLDLPQVQTLSRPEMLELWQNVGVTNKLKILQQYEEILDALEKSEDFGDNYHPGPEPHMKLVQELNQVFNKK
jgi:hypothetical protein